MENIATIIVSFVANLYVGSRIQKGGNNMNYYRVDYYSPRKGAYTYKIIKAATYEDAIRKARIKNIREVTIVGTEKVEQ